MKPIIALFIFLFSFSTLFAQTLYTRKDTIAITQDSITLQAGQFWGAIQWQHSLDGQQWNNLPKKPDSLLKVAATAEGYYRAQLTDGSCLPTYSDTAVVVIPKTKNEMVTAMDNISGATFIDRDDSVFTYIGTPGTSIPINTVLVDDKLESDIRVVTDVTQNGDTIKVKTEPGTMEDLFVNQEFKLSTAIMTTTKSAFLSTSALAKAMKDGNGVIHPVEVIDNNAPSNNLKSAQSTDESLPGVYFRNDFSGETIWEEGGVSITFDQAYYQLGAELNYEFKFEQQGFDWKNLQLPKGKLTKFKICTDKEASGIESKMIIKATTSHEFKKEETKVIRKDVFNKTFKYLVFVPPSPIPIPFWATVKVDLMRRSSSNISGEASVSGGATGNYNIELGAIYENGTWTTIKPTLTPKFTLEGPDVDAKVNVQAKVEVYPHIEVAFYSTMAPYIDIAPYLKQEMEFSSSGNYKYDLYAGVDARVGVKAEVFGEELLNFVSDNVNLNEKNLYTAPKKLQVVSGSNQTNIPGKPLPNPIVIKILDSKDKPVKNAIVNFKAKLGSLFKSVLGTKSAMLNNADDMEISVASDSTGHVSVNWVMAETTAKDTLDAYLKDGTDTKIDSSSISINTQSCGCDTIKYKYFVDSRDGHKYKTIEIGSQTWMAENLAYLPVPIDTIQSLTTPQYFGFTNQVYYNWSAANKACPKGWHLPSDEEWKLLIDFVGNNNSKSLASSFGWNNNFMDGSPGKNQCENNESCFTGIPLGTYAYTQNYNDKPAWGAVGIGNSAYWWSCIVSDARPWWSLGFLLTYGSSTPTIIGTVPQDAGLSVRCIKDF